MERTIVGARWYRGAHPCRSAGVGGGLFSTNSHRPPLADLLWGGRGITSVMTSFRFAQAYHMICAMDLSLSRKHPPGGRLGGCERFRMPNNYRAQRGRKGGAKPPPGGGPPSEGGGGVWEYGMERTIVEAAPNWLGAYNSPHLSQPLAAWYRAGNNQCDDIFSVCPGIPHDLCYGPFPFQETPPRGSTRGL